MSATVFCVKLQKDGTRLAAPPFPGKLGEQIYQQVSKEVTPRKARFAAAT